MRRDMLVGELRTIGRATLALAVIAMVVTREKGLVDVNSVGHSFAQAMTSENHLDFDVDFLIRNSEV